MPAGERYGAGREAHERIEAEELGEAHPHDILQADEKHRAEEEDDHADAAVDQHPEARREAYGGEEGHHQEVLQRAVECQVEKPGLVADEREDGEKDAAEHRDGNEEPLQDREHLLYDRAEQQQNY